MSARDADPKSVGQPPVGVIRRLIASWCALAVTGLQTTRDIVLGGDGRVKVVRYSFGINTTVKLGQVGQPITLEGTPDVRIFPERIIVNAPCPGFAILDDIRVANVSITVGVQEDAYNYSALAQHSWLKLPPLSPWDRAVVLGEMTGYVPPGFQSDTSYLFTASFQGPAELLSPSLADLKRGRS